MGLRPEFRTRAPGCAAYATTEVFGLAAKPRCKALPSSIFYGVILRTSSGRQRHLLVAAARLLFFATVF